MFSRHFEMPVELTPKDENLELRLTRAVIDQYEREHLFLPVGFVYVPDGKCWYAEP